MSLFGSGMIPGYFVDTQLIVFAIYTEALAKVQNYVISAGFIGNLVCGLLKNHILDKGIRG